MAERTATCPTCGDTFHTGQRGPVASRCNACRSKPFERSVICAWCGDRFMQFGRGQPATACAECRQHCAIKGCDKKPQKATGLCAAHYRRSRIGTELNKPIRQYETGERLCKVEGCGHGRAAKSATYCGPHLREHTLDYHRLWRYGLTPEAYAALLAVQDGLCAICRTNDPKGARISLWNVDHDHSCCPGTKSCGECIRGLLCGPCNRAIGQFGDDPAVVEAAAAYLRRYKASA